MLKTHLYNNKTIMLILALVLMSSISHTKAVENPHEEGEYISPFVTYYFQKIESYINTIIAYYENQPLYLRGIILLVSVFREYMLHLQHLQFLSKSNQSIDFFILTSAVFLFVYDAYIDWFGDGNEDDLNYQNQDVFVSFDVPHHLFSQNHNYHNLSQQSGITILQISIATIDNQFYAFSKYQIGDSVKIKPIRLLFKNNVSDMYFFELSCVEGIDKNPELLLPLSVFSEEVFSQIFSSIDETNEAQVYNLTSAIGETFSFSKDLFLGRLEMSPSLKTNTFSICIKSKKKVYILEKEFSNSREALIDEIMVGSKKQQYGWFSYISTLGLKQFEHLASLFWISKTFQYIFSGDCAICLSHMSLWIDIAHCGRHWFCSRCLSENVKHGNLRCPLCNQ